jgi:hypothetical protein
MDQLKVSSEKTVDTLMTLYHALPFGKWIILMTTLAVCAGFLYTLLFEFSWGMFRRHGAPSWVMYLMVYVGVLLIFVQISGAALAILYDLNTMTAVWILTVAVPLLAALYVSNELRESGTFNFGKFVGFGVCPLLMGSLPTTLKGLSWFGIVFHCGAC